MNLFTNFKNKQINFLNKYNFVFVLIVVVTFLLDGISKLKIIDNFYQKLIL